MTIHELFAYICVSDANAAIDFYQRAFGARELFRLTEPSGRIGHAELDFNGTTLMIAEEYDELGIRSPLSLKGTTLTLHLHVDNADTLVERALSCGATLEMPMRDHFYGERSGSVFDPFGHRWLIGHSIEKLSPEEMQRRYTAMFEST